MKRIRFSEIIGIFLLAAFVIPQAAKAQYTANAGAETKDESIQADAFLPNELWIWAGDTITWNFVPQNEVHTVTFLKPNQVRPLAPPPVGPPGPPPPFVFAGNCTLAAGTATYGGTTCISSAPLSAVPGKPTFTVTFTTPGNFKLVCLVHTDMNGTVHVLQSKDSTKPFYAASLPFLQSDYERQARDQAGDILKDDGNQLEEVSDFRSGNNVIAGIGEVVATGGGLQYRAGVRFLKGTIHIHAGDSVTFTNLDPTEPHTVTFGTEPGIFVPTAPAGLSLPAGDGTVLATITCSTTPCDKAFGPADSQPFSPASFLSSGFLQAQAPDRAGSAQLVPGTTRITITFPTAGHFYYHCALHDVDGMVGEVVVDK